MLSPVTAHSGAEGTLGDGAPGPRLTIVAGPFQEHASRGCKGRGKSSKPVACICAGASTSLAWLIPYTYSADGFSESFPLSRAYVRVEHSGIHYLTSSGLRRRKLRALMVTEYWKVNDSGTTDRDCLHFEWPYSPLWCGLDSRVHTVAELVVASRTDFPSVTWSDSESYAYNDNGDSKPIPGKPDAPKTPEDIKFTLARGSDAYAIRTLVARPSHCNNGSSYVNFSGVGGVGVARNSRPAPEGSYYPPKGGPITDEPPDDLAQSRSRGTDGGTTRNSLALRISPLAQEPPTAHVTSFALGLPTHPHPTLGATAENPRHE